MGGDLGGIIGGLALLVGAFFTGLIGWRNAGSARNSADAERLSQYERWRPRVIRAFGDVRAVLAEHRVPEPEGIDDVLEFPPKTDKKVTPDA